MRKRTMLYLGGIVMLAVVSGGVSGPGAAFATDGHHPDPTAPVVEPQVQDYVTCDGAAFVLDNTSNAVDVRYTVAGHPFKVAAGTAVHTDADGYRFPADIGPYTITADPGGRSWTFAPPTGCAPSTPPTTPVVGAPDLHFDAEQPCAPHEVYVRYAIPAGLSVAGYTGSGSVLDLEFPIDLGTPGPGKFPDDPRKGSWTFPVVVLPGFTYDGPTTVTLYQERTTCPTTTGPTTPPTGEPTTPAPSAEPTTPAPGTPSPTAGTTPPASSPSAPPSATVHTSSPSSSATAAPVAASTSDGNTTRELAYTGLDRAKAIAIVAVAIGLLALGGVILTIRTRAYRRDDA